MSKHPHTSRLSSFLAENRYRSSRHLLLQALLVFISVGIFFDAPDQINLSTNRLYGWLSYYLFLNVLVYFNAFVLYPCFLARNKALVYFLTVVAFLIFLGYIMTLLQSRFYDISIFHQEEISTVAKLLNISASIFSLFLFTGGISALLLLKQWILNQRQIRNLKKATYQSELTYLKSQINPHFLFNMLNNATILMEEEPELAVKILENLHELLHYQLQESTQEHVNLAADIHFLRNFLSLEKTRRDHFEFTINTEGNPRPVYVPPFLFIPFVENAVKHNLDHEALSYVQLSFIIHPHRILFTCKNSLPRKEVPKKPGGLGLTNIQRRLYLLYKDTYELEQTKTDHDYTVHLKINI